jgi:hypothetical protein
MTDEDKKRAAKVKEFMAMTEAEKLKAERAVKERLRNLLGSDFEIVWSEDEPDCCEIWADGELIYRARRPAP